MKRNQNNVMRNKMLAKIHILAAQQGMDTRDKSPDSTYRQMIKRIAGSTTTSNMDQRALDAVLRHLDGKSNRPKGTPQARLIRHLWACLYDAGAVNSHDGINAWLRNTTRHSHPQRTGWDRPEFLPKKETIKVIEQLKKWAERLNIDWEKGHK